MGVWPLVEDATCVALETAIEVALNAAAINPMVPVVDQPTIDRDEQILVGDRLDGDFEVETVGLGCRDVQDRFTLTVYIVTARRGRSVKEARARWVEIASVVAGCVPDGSLLVTPLQSVSIVPIRRTVEVGLDPDLQGSIADGYVEFQCRAYLQILS
jgi:hypothetical protein